MINSKLHYRRNHVTVEPLSEVCKLLKENAKVNNANFTIFNGTISSKPLMQRNWTTCEIPETGVSEGWHKIYTVTYPDFQCMFSDYSLNTIVADCEGEDCEFEGE